VGDTSTTTLGWYGLHVYGWEQDIMPIDLEWHHLGASYDGTTLKWYGDGLLIGSQNRALNTPDNVHVGKREDNDNYFPGQVDDFRIYNRVLSDEEMAGLAGITLPYDKPF
ncbi:MAG: LamG domain-containing protein, partial [Phycisphaerales bacterium]